MQINTPFLFFKQLLSNRKHTVMLALLILLVLFFSAVGYSAEAEQGTDSINSPSSGTIDGTVFRDFNGNGTQSASEPGVKDITVTAYDSAGVLQGTTTTIADGTYNLVAAGTGPYRIEFSAIPSYLQVGANGVDSDSAVQFLADGNSSNVNMGLNNPADYNQVDPDVAVSMMTNGDQTAGNSTIRVTSSNTSTVGVTDKAIDSLTGSIWGLAYQRSSDTLFSAAFLKRHVAFGSGGMDTIYATDSTTTTVFVELFDDLGISVGAEPASRGLGADNQPSYDVEAYSLIGKRGLGDIDYDDNSSTLWVVNLNDGRLYGIANIDPSTTPVVADVLTDSGSALGFEIDTSPAIVCNNGQLRPFAVKVHDDKVYVGAICSGEDVGAVMADVDAHILALDLNNTNAGFSEVIAFSMDYSREKGTYGGPTAWVTWYFSDNAYLADWVNIMPQPMLTDIEIDNDGSLILGFNDRFGHQTGPNNYHPDPAESDTTLTDNDNLSAGEILRVCNSNTGYFIEGHVNCPNNNPRPASEDADNAGIANRGPGGGEYYIGDWGPGDPDEFGETTSGGLAVIPGSDYVMVTAFDPIGYYEGGINWLDNGDGSKASSRMIYSGGIPFFGKAAGIGDIELLSDPAPLEIGNRLWCDVDSDGIQDAGESAAPAGAAVTMTCGAESATTTTDTNGNYLFTDAIWNAANGGADIPYATSCTISIDTSGVAGTIISNACGVSTPTTMNAASGLGDGNDDVRDSDATQNGSNVEIAITTGSAGQNDHTYDFGFGTAIATVEIGNRIWIEADGDGIADNDASDQPVVGTVVTAVNGSSTSYTTTTDAAGLYTITVPANTTYTVTVPTPASHDPSTVIVAGTDSDPATNNNNNHANSGAVVTVDTANNYTIDFGFTPQAGLKKVEIGNYVWLDSDQNGGQNESGTGLAGVVVGIYAPIGSTPIATTTTDATGYYTFTKAIHTILPSTNYVIRIDTAQAALSGYNPTNADSTAGGTDDSTDSDGVLVTTGPFTDYVAVALTSPIAGAVDYSYDFGFIQTSADWGDLPISSAVTSAEDGPHHLAPSGTVTPTIWLGTTMPDYEANGVESINADGDDTAGSPDDEDGFFRFTSLVAGEPMLTFVEVSGDGASSTADVGYWIDWDANGFFTDTVDFFEFYDDYATGNAASPSYIEQLVMLGASVTPVGSPRVRIRVYPAGFATEASHANVLPTGGVTDGEIEDHLITFDFTAVGLREGGTGSAETTLFLTFAIIALLGTTLLLTRRRDWSK